MQACDPALQPEAVEAFLASVPPFDRLPARDLADLAAGSRVAFYLAGEAIDPPGADGGWVCCVQRGGVRLDRTGQGEGSFDVRGEGECFGVFPGADGQVRALEETFLVRLPRAAFDALAGRHPQVAAWFGDNRPPAGEDAPLPAGPSSCPPQDDGDYLFTRSAGEVASRRLVAVPRGTDLRRTARVMEDGQVGSVLVREGSGQVIGIVTDRDLRRAVARGLSPEASVETLMSAPVAEIEAETPCFEALIRMTGAGIRHLLVTRNGEPAGMVTSSDLLLAHGRSPMALLRAIRRAGDFEDLQALCGRIRPLAAALAARGATAATVGGLVTMVAEQVLARLLELLEKTCGRSPVPCAWWVLGAAGRRELLPGMGLSLAVVPRDGCDPVLGRAARTYLAALLPRLGEALGRLGLRDGATVLRLGEPAGGFDPTGGREGGDVLAHEASLEGFDARPVAGCGPGDGEGGVALDRPPLPPASVLAAMLRSLAARPAPLGCYQGRLLERDGTDAPVLDVAGRGSRPLVAMVRLAALLAGVEETGTATRLARLGRDGRLPGDLVRAAADAFAFFENERLLLRLEASGPAGEGEPPLRPAGLSPRRRHGFRTAFAGLEALRLALAGGRWAGEAGQ